MATTRKTKSKNIRTDNLTEKAASEVQNMIQLGELGEPIPSERQLADLLGISRVTMRRAMADLENRGLIQRQQGRGTYACAGPNIISAEKLATIRHKFVVILTEQDGDVFNIQLAPWTWQICLELTSLLEQDDIPIYYVNSMEFMRSAEQNKLDKCDIYGFIAPTHIWKTSTYEMALGLGIPFVGIGRTTKSTYWNIIELDHSDGLRAALSNMRPNPKDRVFIPVEAHPCELDRQSWLESVLSELNHYGVDQQQIIVNGGGMFESDGYLATKWYLREYTAPTMVLADFDLCIIGVYRALMAARENGLISATDLKSLRCLGGGDLTLGRRVSPSFGSLRFSRIEIAKLILDALHRQRESGRPVGLQYLRAEYVARDT